jgi:hypothetical protein
VSFCSLLRVTEKGSRKRIVNNDNIGTSIIIAISILMARIIATTIIGDSETVASSSLAAAAHGLPDDVSLAQKNAAKRKDSYATEFARKGGKARAEKLTPEQGKASAQEAAQARWAKKAKSLKGI